MTEKKPNRLAQIEQWIAIGKQLLLDDEDWLIAEVKRLRLQIAQLTKEKEDKS